MTIELPGYDVVKPDIVFKKDYDGGEQLLRVFRTRQVTTPDFLEHVHSRVDTTLKRRPTETIGQRTLAEMNRDILRYVRSRHPEVERNLGASFESIARGSFSGDNNIAAYISYIPEGTEDLQSLEKDLDVASIYLRSEGDQFPSYEMIRSQVARRALHSGFLEIFHYDPERLLSLQAIGDAFGFVEALYDELMPDRWRELSDETESCLDTTVAACISDVFSPSRFDIAIVEVDLEEFGIDPRKAH